MRKFTLVIILSLFFFLTASGNIDSIDATSHIYLSKQMVEKGRIDFGKDKLAQKMVAGQNIVNRNYYIVYNFGYALFFIPGVVLSNVIRHLLHTPPSLFPAQPDYILTWYANLFNGAVMIATAFTMNKIFKRIDYKEKSNNWFFMLLLVMGTNMVVQGHHQFAHPLFTLCTVLSFWKLWDYKEKQKITDLILFACLFALTASVYNMTFVLLIIPFLVFYLYPSSSKKGFSKSTIYLLFTFLPALTVQLIWNYLRFGHPFLTGYMELGFKIYELNPVENIKNFIAMTLGPNKGLFFNNPILFVSYIVAIRHSLKKTSPYKTYSLFYLALSLCYFANYTLATIWHGESTYGPRYLFILVVFGIPFILKTWRQTKQTVRVIMIVLLVFGILIQIPGLLIPHFSFPHISKPYCLKSDYRYFDPRCSPAVVGWAQLIKRETKETMTVYKKSSDTILTDKYPNPLVPFKTIYPDPFFDAFSKYKTKTYRINEDLFNCIYAFTIDLWWVKQNYYRNISFQ